MATKVIMPKLSPTMEEGQISRWLKKEGDKVSMGEPLAEIDTDKATMEMQARANGVLRKILVNEGQSAPLGQTIAVIGEPNEDIAALVSEAPPKQEQAQQQEQEKAAPPAPQQPQPQAKAAAASAQPSSRVDGRQPQAATADSGRLIVSPLAARMAAEAGIDLRSLQGSGPGGRIIKKDIEAAISQPKAAPAPQTFPRAVEPGRFPQVAASGYRDEPASEIRKVIAKRLVTSLGPVPHFFLTTEIEMDRAAEMRKGINALDPDLKISINDIIIKVVAAALIQHPEVNASFQEKFIRYYEHADVGVAVAVDEGLITPVVRGADLKGFLEISAEIKDLAGKAKARKLQPEEYTGATFSISNLGMFGIKEFTAIINPPEAGILAVGAAAPTAVVRDGEVIIRNIMNVTMSCDHRVVDGATGAKFLQTFKQMLENPGMMSA
jgi:pyruvate dehydrogenase E2 component (dihydrolipoamide acetyltransferase)